MASEIVRILKLQTVDYFAVLGIDNSASEVDIKQAYRRLARLIHPDKCQSEGAEEAFKMILDAYAVLASGPDDRRKPAGKPVSKEERKQFNKERADGIAAHMSEMRRVRNQGNMPGTKKLKMKEMQAKNEKARKDFLQKKQAQAEEAKEEAKQAKKETRKASNKQTKDKKTHVPAGETNEDVAPVNVSCSQEDEVALRSFPVIGASGHCTSNVGLGNTDGNASDKTNGNSWSFFTSFLFCCLGSQGRGGY